MVAPLTLPTLPVHSALATLVVAAPLFAALSLATVTPAERALGRSERRRTPHSGTVRRAGHLFRSGHGPAD